MKALIDKTKRIEDEISKHELKKGSKYIKKWHSLLTTYNPGHNTLALFNNLAQVGIATSKTILDI